MGQRQSAKQQPTARPKRVRPVRSQMITAFWSNSILTVVPALFRFFSRLFGVPSSAPTTISISQISIHFPKPHELPCQIPISIIFLVILLCTLVSSGTARSTKSAVLLSFSQTTVSGRLCSITWSVWILTSQMISTFSVSITDFAPAHCVLGKMYISTRCWNINRAV